MLGKNRLTLVFIASLLFFAIACRSSAILDRTILERTILEHTILERDGNHGPTWDCLSFPRRPPKNAEYPHHRRIKTTYFYVGQKNRVQAGFLNNGSSAWTSDWVNSYGGVDLPDRRRGYFPKDFRTKENPFYCALPYNDVSFHGHKPKALDAIPWARRIAESSNGDFVSYCKNRWVKITYKRRVCYAQWEDVGPFQTDDWQYVFGTAKPKNRRNGGVGLDLSPACFTYLGMTGNGYTDWQFMEFEDVPPGPWLRVITDSNPDW